MKDIILDIKNLNFGYKNEYVLENTELKIYRGDFVALIGSNGTGDNAIMMIVQ